MTRHRAMNSFIPLVAISVTPLVTPIHAAPRTPSGLALVVPEEHAALGRVYEVMPGQDAQATFTSEALLGRIVGTSAAAVGYLITPLVFPSDAAVSEIPPIYTGEFRVPVASIDTGIPARNEHMRSSRWLDAVEAPDLVFRLDHAEHAAPLLASGQAGVPDGARIWSIDLVGEITVHGVTRPLRVTAARLTALPESPITHRRGPGDLLILRAEFELNLRDFNINDPAISAGLVSETIAVDVFLPLSTASPDAVPEGSRTPID